MWQCDICGMNIWWVRYRVHADTANGDLRWGNE